LLLMEFISPLRRLAYLALLSLSACGTLIGLGDLERTDCADVCPDGGAVPAASTSGFGSGEQVGGSTPPAWGGGFGGGGSGALDGGGSGGPPPGAGGTMNGNTTGGTDGTTGGANGTPGGYGGVGAGAGTAPEGSSGGGSDVGGGGRGEGYGAEGPLPSGGGSTVTLPIRINFQPSSAAVPAGYVADTGLTFAAHDALSFGWNVDHTDVTRARGVNSNQLLDTLCQFHEGGMWELALPNGTYGVRISIGDPSITSVYTLIVEGVTYWEAQLIRANQFSTNARSIIVADGRLTLSQGPAGELATRINFVEVTTP
jgi:hypothetical protein